MNSLACRYTHGKVVTTVWDTDTDHRPRNLHGENRVVLKNPVNVFEIGQQLYETKQMFIKRGVEAAQAAGANLLNAERNAASSFHFFARDVMQYSPATAKQYVRVYERFADSTLRSRVEGLFGVGDLAMLAVYTDDELNDVVSAKEADPSMTREQLRLLLKKRQAA